MESIKDKDKIAFRIKNLFLNFFLILCVLTQAQEESKEMHPYVLLTKRYIGAIKRNIPNRNAPYFDTTFFSRMIEAQAEKTLAEFLKEKGEIKTIEKTVVDTQGCKMATSTIIKTNGGKFLWYHHYDQAQQIQKFYIDTFDKQPFYVAEKIEKVNFIRKDVNIVTNAFIQLPGYLYLPSGAKKSPLVILVHGSGPHDRNGTMGKNKVYLEIALQLAQKGIACLIYDKRTYVYQFRDPFPMDSMDYYTETIEDAAAAFELMKKTEGVDSTSIYVAGHSLGGMCAPLIVKECKGIKGMILLSAPARGLLEVLPEQIEYITGLNQKNKEQNETVANAIKWQVKNALSPDLNLKSKTMLPFGARPKYWLLDRKYKVLDEAKGLTLPILLIQGGRDYNVTKKDFDLWVNAMSEKKNFKSVWLENLDHLYFDGVGMAKPDDAIRPQHVSKLVGNTIEGFIKAK
ncbi:MAG: alpha/beta fold hydrolase [Sphingobacteriaceae bacterium]|nr:alpha/beta fold hydrolase [Sphingobacteriaceae bacterium]